jgi:hypothetical protein
MIDHEPPLTLTFGAILRVGVPVSILWMIGDAIDGGSQSFIGVPLLVAAWLGAFVALDRWVSGHVDQKRSACEDTFLGGTDPRSGPMQEKSRAPQDAKQGTCQRGGSNLN